MTANRNKVISLGEELVPVEDSTLTPAPANCSSGYTKTISTNTTWGVGLRPSQGDQTPPCDASLEVAKTISIDTTSTPGIPSSMSWIAEALQAERAAIVNEMTRRHQALLRNLELAAGRAVDASSVNHERRQSHHRRPFPSRLSSNMFDSGSTLPENLMFESSMFDSSSTGKKSKKDQFASNTSASSSMSDLSDQITPKTQMFQALEHFKAPEVAKGANPNVSFAAGEEAGNFLLPKDSDARTAAAAEASEVARGANPNVSFAAGEAAENTLSPKDSDTRITDSAHTTESGNMSPTMTSRKSVKRVREQGPNYREKLETTKGMTYIRVYLQSIVLSNAFEVLLAGLIVLNSLIMAVEAQYLSFNTAHDLDDSSQFYSETSADAKWPGAKTCLFVIEVFFGSAFLLEVVLKILAAPGQFARSAWCWFDFFIVISWVLSLRVMSAALGFSNTTFGSNTMVLRLLRIVRLLRLVRLVKTFQLFDVLHLLIGSLKASGLVLLWSVVLLATVMLAGALVCNFVLESFIQDSSNPIAKREAVYEYFGSFSRAFFTMFEMTLGNWAPPMRLLQEDVSEWYGAVGLVYVCVMSFAVVQVIRAVFIHETLKVANLDDEIMIMQQDREIKKHALNMERLFAEADETGEGYISFEQFEEVTSDPRMKSWLAAMDFQISDAKLVFELIDDGDQKLSATELAVGVRRLKGTARSIDMVSLLTVCRRIERHMVHTALGRKIRINKGSKGSG